MFKVDFLQNSDDYFLKSPADKETGHIQTPFSISIFSLPSLFIYKHLLTERLDLTLRKSTVFGGGINTGENTKCCLLILCFDQTMFLEYIYTSLKGFSTYSVMLLAFSIASDIPAAIYPLNIIAFSAFK